MAFSSTLRFHLFFPLLLSCLLSSSLYAQNVALLTQAEVDAFATTHPNPVFQGSLFIEGADITNTFGLSHLRRVEGYLGISNCPQLTGLSFTLLDSVVGTFRLENLPLVNDLDGLSSLRDVTNQFHIENLTGLTDFVGLNFLSKIGGGMSVVNMPSLQSLEGLNLEEVGDGLVLNKLPALTSFGFFGLKFLRKVEGEFQISCENLANLNNLSNLEEVGGNFGIGNCEALTDFSALSKLKKVGAFYIYSCDNLTSVNGLNALDTVFNVFQILECSDLTTINGLNNLKFVGVDLTLSFCTNLANLNAFASLKKIGRNLELNNTHNLLIFNGLNALDTISGILKLRATNRLLSLSGLQSLKYIGDDFDLYECTDLQNFAALSNLNHVGGDFIVGRCGISDLTGLSGLQTVGGNFELSANTCTSFNGLTGLKRIEGYLQIISNSSLTTIGNGFSALTFVGKNLYFGFHASLIQLSGFSQLTSVGRGLTISDNPNLENIAAFQALTAINGDLWILTNPALTDISGLSNINHASILGLQIQGNNSLSVCHIKSICDYLSIAANPAIIDNNAPGCIFRSSILALCNSTVQCAVITQPQNGATYVPVYTPFFWNQSVGAQYYLVSIGTTPGGSELLADFNVGNSNQYFHNAPLPKSTTVYFRVKPFGANNTTAICPEISFFTQPFQPCYVSGVTFARQGQIDSFPILNPGCNRIEGTLSINEGAATGSITNLDGLQQLDYIGFELNILGSLPGLTNLNGLSNLDSIFDDVVLDQLSAVQSLNGLGGLQSIGGVFAVSNTKQLVDYGNFPNLKKMGGFRSRSNEKLTSIGQYPQLDSIHGDFEIRTNAKLKHLDGFSELNHIDGSLDLMYLDSLEQVNGLSKLSGDLQGLTLLVLGKIQNLNGLSGVQAIRGNLEIDTNWELTDIDGIGQLNLDSVPYLSLAGNRKLSVCNVPSICSYLSRPNPAVVLFGNAAGCLDANEVLAGCAPVPLPACSAPNLPLPNATDVPAVTAIRWFSSSNATGYKLSVGTSPGLANLLNNADLGSDTIWQSPNPFPFGTTIFVKISPYNAAGAALNCQEYSFTTEDLFACLPNGTSFATQAALDSFALLHPNCNQVGGDISIRGDITNLAALAKVQVVKGNLTISNTTNLTQLVGLTNMTVIEGNLTIEKNAELTSLAGFTKLKQVDGNIIIFSQPKMTSVNGFWELNHVGGGVSVLFNPKLDNFDGFGALKTIDGGLSVLQNAGITTMTAFSQLHTLGKSMAFTGNTKLPNINSLQNLRTIGAIPQQLEVDLPTHIPGFVEANANVGNLTLRQNNSLNSLLGIQNIQSQTIGQLTIENQPILSACAVESVCDFLEVQPINAFISGNASGCAFISEVQTACASVSAKEVMLMEASWSIYPNPVKNRLVIQSKNLNFAYQAYRILDVTGKIVQSGNLPADSSIEVADLAVGIFVIQVFSENGWMNRRFVKATY